MSYCWAAPYILSKSLLLVVGIKLADGMFLSCFKFEVEVAARYSSGCVIEDIFDCYVDP